MFTISSKYDDVNIYAVTIEQEAISQITAMANSPLGESAHIRIMPDAHAGKGCTIGTTMYIVDKVCPNLVGVDIGCGMYGVHLRGELTADDIAVLDNFCNQRIYSGMNVRTEPVIMSKQNKLIPNLRCYEALTDVTRLYNSMGTLGGGNHFIELDQAGDGSYWLIIHSGSRNLGKQVAEYYQHKAEQVLTDNYTNARRAIIEQLKQENRQTDIQAELAKITKMPATGLEYLTGKDMEDYLHDMAIVQQWANLNRRFIATSIVDNMGWDYTDTIETIHNYIDIENMILRKGSISANYNERCLIPMNMRDGTLICRGKGNAEWNYSAPHGAGRLMSRAKAKQEIKLQDFEQSMKGIVSSTVCDSTIDESPFAYKDYHEIMEAVKDTVWIEERIIPVFNYKATT